MKLSIIFSLERALVEPRTNCYKTSSISCRLQRDFCIATRVDRREPFLLQNFVRLRLRRWETSVGNDQHGELGGISQSQK